ncbi:hypothetical protein [Mesorhizobium sp. 1M-11]|uniref:hypothetical protein n=1 Tax=Mesorhizobium sp. 1M-11 TaxID=1529006 RepID=UPI0006C756B0|nr:hypothetical protein [Mesorhizobium sp. 1M-11]
MAKMSLELSDGLQQLKRLFVDYQHEPRVLEPDDARIIQQCIELCYARARELENEVSAKRWNDEARRDRLVEMDRILSEIQRPGTNVMLFPVVERPIFEGSSRL